MTSVGHKMLRARHALSLLAVFCAALCAGAPARAQDAAGPTPSQTPTPAAETPALAYGLVVDNSGSMRSDMGHVIEAVHNVVRGNRAGDEAFLVRFVDGDKIQLAQDFTRSKDALMRAADDMYIEGGQTAITDALYTAAEHLAESTARRDAGTRRALVLITDGDDRASAYKPEQLMALLREKRIQVFVLGMPKLVRKDRGKKAQERAVAFMNTLAQETGGRAILVDNASELGGKATELLDALHGK